MQTLYCSNCGTELNTEAKFCYSCGTKVRETKPSAVNNEVKNDAVSQKLYEQYHDIVCGKVIEAYLNDTGLATNILYQNGVSYGLTEEDVNKIVSKQENQIETFVKYLESLYIDGILIIPDCTFAKEDECIEFGINMGLDEDFAADIYHDFLEKHNINEKYLIVCAQLVNYQNAGEIADFESIPASKEMDNDKFYVRFLEAVSELETYQQSLHEKSGSIDLSESDMRQLRKKASELGFYDILADSEDEDSDEECSDLYIIDMLINGAEIKLGYAEKHHEKMFSTILPVKTIALLGEEICFESSYFIDGYVEKTFQNGWKIKKQVLVDALNKVSQNFNTSEVDIIIDNCGKLLYATWESGFLSVLKGLPIDESNKEELSSYAHERYFNKAFEKFNSKVGELGSYFNMIDADVEDVRREGEMNREFRGRWTGGGFGLKGAVTGAITASALNAGSGLIYGIANAVSNSKAQSKAEKRKRELFDTFLESVDNDIASLARHTVKIVHDFLFERYQFAYSRKKRGNEEELHHQYCNEENIQKKRSLAVQLLKANPKNKKNYTPLFEQAYDEPEEERKHDIDAILDIAACFHVNIKEVRQNVENVRIKETLQNRQMNYLERCEALLELENLFGHQLQERRTQIFENYLASNEMATLKEYTFQELCLITDTLKNFGERFSYQTDKHITEQVEKYIKYHMENELTEYTPGRINALFDKINAVYDKFPEMGQLLDDTKQKVIDAIFSYHKINLNTEKKQEITHNINRLKYLDEKCNWDFSSFLEKENAKLKEITDKEDIDSRTVDNVLYDTVEEANAANEELNIFVKIEEDPSLSAPVKVYKMMQCELKTEQARSYLKELELVLINRIEELRANSDRESSIGSFLVTLLGTLVAGFIGLMFVPIGLVVAILFIIGSWITYFDKYKEVKKHNLEIAEGKREIKEFEQLFRVENNRLIKR